jgi:transcriptional regulator with XRE-family HTH domain
VPDLGGGSAETLGALLARVRLARGRSQLRVAELVCAASGMATVTRHEVSRWERDLRLPGAHWLRWLAVVLEVPLDELERAAAVTRALRAGCAEPAGPASAGARSGAAAG